MYRDTVFETLEDFVKDLFKNTIHDYVHREKNEKAGIFREQRLEIHGDRVVESVDIVKLLAKKKTFTFFKYIDWDLENLIFDCMNHNKKEIQLIEQELKKGRMVVSNGVERWRHPALEYWQLVRRIRNKCVKIIFSLNRSYNEEILQFIKAM